MQFELGIDEAGRGPVFGTMVYSALWWPISMKQSLSKLGFDDSKQLSEERREQLFQLINILKDKIIFYQIRQLTATQISTNMNNLKYNINLNQLSHNAALQLCRRAFDQKFKIVRIYADTVGDSTKYANFLHTNLNKHLQTLKQVIVQSKADSKFKVVSASSICAKVVRDHIIKNWNFVQGLCNFYQFIKYFIEFKGELGSGYPGDPKTKQWLVDNKHHVFGYPNIVRFSWSTAGNCLKDVLKVKVKEDEEQENKLKKLNYIEKNKSHMHKDIWHIVGK